MQNRDISAELRIGQSSLGNCVAPSRLPRLISKPTCLGRFPRIRPVVTIMAPIKLMKGLISCRILCYGYSPLRSKNVMVSASGAYGLKEIQTDLNFLFFSLE